MAFQLASAYVELSHRGVSGVTSAIAGLRQQMGGLVGLATAAAGAMAGLAGVAGLTGLVKLAADAETTNAQFETLLGSTEKAKSLVKELKDFGASTPFEFPGLADTAKSLLAFGVTQDQIVPTLKVLGDTAAATGKPIGELAQIYGKAMSSGRLMTEQLDQLGERGIPIARTLATQFGVTDAQIREMASQGKISFADLQRAMVSMTSEGGVFAGGMEKQSKTLAGLWSTATDDITSLLTEIGTALVEGIDLSGIVASMTEFVASIKDSVIPTIKEWVAGIVGFVTANQTFLMELAKGAALVVGATALVMGLGAAFVALTSPIGLVAVAIGGLAAIFPGLFSGIMDTLIELAKNWDIYWRLAIAHTVLLFTNLWERIKAWGMNVAELAGWVVDNFFRFFETGVNLVGSVFSNLWTNIKAGWQALLDWFAGKPVTFDWTPLTEGFQNTISELPNFTRPAVQDTNAEIERLNRQLISRANQSEAAAAKDAQSAQSQAAATAGLAIDSAAGGTKSKSKEKTGDKFAFVGLAQLAEKMQTEAANKADEKKKEQLAERQAAAAEKLAAKAEGDGVKVVVTNNPNVNSGLTPAYG